MTASRSGLCRRCAELREEACPKHPDQPLEDPSNMQVQLSLLEEDGKVLQRRSMFFAMVGSAMGLATAGLVLFLALYDPSGRPPALRRGGAYLVAAMGALVAGGYGAGRKIALQTTPRRFDRWTSELRADDEVLL